MLLGQAGAVHGPLVFFTIILIHNSRASRLVVDTGMHALGWSRDRAVAFMADNTAASQQNIQAEIDRYITWPGQVWSLCTLSSFFTKPTMYSRTDNIHWTNKDS